MVDPNTSAIDTNPRPFRGFESPGGAFSPENPWQRGTPRILWTAPASGGVTASGAGHVRAAVRQKLRSGASVLPPPWDRYGKDVATWLSVNPGRPLIAGLAAVAAGSAVFSTGAVLIAAGVTVTTLGGTIIVTGLVVGGMGVVIGVIGRDAATVKQLLCVGGTICVAGGAVVAAGIVMQGLGIATAATGAVVVVAGVVLVGGGLYWLCREAKEKDAADRKVVGEQPATEMNAADQIRQGAGVTVEELRKAAANRGIIIDTMPVHIVDMSAVNPDAVCTGPENGSYKSTKPGKN